jgi:hypothetical protein
MNASASLAASITNFQLARVASAADWDHVLALRYRALLQRGDIPENASQRHGDEHDPALHAMTFLLRRNGRPAGTTRTMLSANQRRWPVPAAAVFQRELDSALGTDATYIEMGLTAVGPAPQDDPRIALFHLFKAAVVHGLLENADWVITAVRENQIGFYGRMFNMQILSGPEALPGLAHPRVLMGLDFRDQMRILEKRIPTLVVTPSELDEFAASGAVETSPRSLAGLESAQERRAARDRRASSAR